MNDTDKKLGLDELQAIITDIVRNGDGPDKFRAIRMVKELLKETGAGGLPEPLTDDEMYTRAGRILKGLGPVGSQISYRKAFPWSQMPISHEIPQLLPVDVETGKKWPETLKQLYKAYPEIKRHGFPPGFPARRSVETKAKWCREQAVKIEQDRKQAAIVAAATADREADGQTPHP